MQEQRWAARRPVTVDIELHVGRFPTRYMVHCRTRDLSFNGALLRTKNMPDHEDLPASVVFISGKGNQQQRLSVQARIVRDEDSGVALEFLSMNPETMRYLQNILFNADQYKMMLHNIIQETVH